MEAPPPVPGPLTPAAAARLLRASAAAMAGEVRALPPDLAAWRQAPGEWCALEVVGHVEAERRAFAGRIALLLDEAEPRLATWDQQGVAADRRDCDRALDELATELLALRERSARLLEGLGPGDLRRAGEHPDVGRLTVGDVMHDWVSHDRVHLEQLLELTRALARPHLGNASRFSG